MSKKFKKQEYHRYSRVGKTDVWRKPRGHHSKMREHRKGNPQVVDAGFGNEASLRGMHPSGLFEAMVSSEGQLAAVDKKTQGVRISARLSVRNKVALTEKAKKLGLKVFNPAKPKAKPKTEPKAKPKGEPEAKSTEAEKK